jgi:hypothetical protein
MTRLISLLLALVLAFAGCGGDDADEPNGAATAETMQGETAEDEAEEEEPDESASEFVKANTEMAMKAQFGRTWANLHPALQQVTTRAAWEACQRKSHDELALVKVHELEVVEEYPDPHEAPGVGRVDAVAVTMRMEFEHPLLEGRREVTDTVHVVNVDGEWKGIWNAERYEAYANGRCPDDEATD